MRRGSALLLLGIVVLGAGCGERESLTSSRSAPRVAQTNNDDEELLNQADRVLKAHGWGHVSDRVLILRGMAQARANQNLARLFQDATGRLSRTLTVTQGLSDRKQPVVFPVSLIDFLSAMRAVVAGDEDNAAALLEKPPATIGMSAATEADLDMAARLCQAIAVGGDQDPFKSTQPPSEDCRVEALEILQGRWLQLWRNKAQAAGPNDHLRLRFRITNIPELNHYHAPASTLRFYKELRDAALAALPRP